MEPGAHLAEIPCHVQLELEQNGIQNIGLIPDLSLLKCLSTNIVFV